MRLVNDVNHLKRQMNTADNMPTVLLIATFDTKAEEALYLQRKMESLGCRVLSMDTGILEESGTVTDINRHQVAKAGESSIREMVASGDKGKCIDAMRKGACVLSRKLYDAGEFQGVISIGGAQGTDIGTATMRELPFGVPKFMVSTVASGRATVRSASWRWGRWCRLPSRPPRSSSPRASR